jgi:methylated-DNA-protein-cysteine methyltransferase-like protein
MMAKTDFSANVIKLVKAIPRGKVATYGLIAKLAGKSHGARGVGWLLHSSTKAHGLPWQRVLNSKGTISFKKTSSNYKEQKRLLQKEGVVFMDDRVDLKKYLWNKKRKLEKKARLTPSLFS